MKRSGFSLVEMLVVMAIIAILSGMILPVFSQVREKGRQTICASNLKQIGLAINLYLQDYGHYVPAIVGETIWLEVAPGRQGLLDPYIRAEGVRQCPSRQKPEARYCINGWAGAPNGFSETSPQGQTDATVPRPANTLIVWEHQVPAFSCITGQQGGTTSVPDPEAGVAHWDSAHHGGFLTLWCDGHVRRMRYADLRRTYFTIEEDPE